MTETIVIKGISQGVLAGIPETRDWSALCGDLLKLIDQRSAFFKGAQLVLDVAGRDLPNGELVALMDDLEKRGVQLVAILSHSETTNDAATQAKLATNLDQVKPPIPAAKTTEDELPAIDSEEYGTGGVLIKRTLRNGRTVHSNGHVLVIGDVNSGAEIIAVGDVVVWGRLRGIVHAGAQGDESAVVCALEMAPTQLRIASLITIPPKENRQPKPEKAFIAGGKIQAEPWS